MTVSARRRKMLEMGLLSPGAAGSLLPTTSIGTTDRDYSTITLWEADLDDTDRYSENDDAVGEMYNDSVFDESVTINGGGTVGLNSVTLTVAEGERHDGTAGTGAIVRSSSNSPLFSFGANALTKAVRWIESDLSSAEALSGQRYLVARHSGGVSICDHCLMHGASSFQSAKVNYIRIRASSGTTLNNSIIYDTGEAFTGDAGEKNVIENDGNVADIFNVTMHNCYNDGSSGSINGVKLAAGANARNVLITDVTAVTSSACFSGSATEDHNASSDATASGTGSLTNIVTADQYVSTVGGSEDLHLKPGSDCIDAGTDLGTTPSGVEIDIDGNDRDAAAVTWDIGAHEFEL